MAGNERKPIAPMTFERVWRGSGLAFVVTFLVAYIVHGSPPDIDESTSALDSFYDGDRTRVLIGSALLGLANQVAQLAIHRISDDASAQVASRVS